MSKTLYTDRNSVVIVDGNDLPIGVMDKTEAHKKGILHRAFSVFIFNNKQEILLHQRADNKYHGAGLWTNACCSHPQLNENVKESAIERLHYEMGLQCDVKNAFSFIYHTSVENGLIEHEYDHIFVGYTNAEPAPNPSEVKAFKWSHPRAVISDMQLNPHHYTYWFKSAFPKVLDFCHGCIL